MSGKVYFSPVYSPMYFSSVFSSVFSLTNDTVPSLRNCSLLLGLLGMQGPHPTNRNGCVNELFPERPLTPTNF